MKPDLPTALGPGDYLMDWAETLPDASMFWELLKQRVKYRDDYIVKNEVRI